MTTDEIESGHVEEMTSEEASFVSRKHLDANCKASNIHRRPNAGNGAWLCCLVPLALLVNAWTHPKSSSLLYKVSGFIGFGLFLQTAEIIFKLSCRRVIGIINVPTKLLPGIACSLLIWFLLEDSLIFTLCALPCCLIYNSLYISLLQRMPRSFSLGEAAIVSQGLAIFLFGAGIKIFDALQDPSMFEMEQMTAILSVAILAVLLLILLLHVSSCCRHPLVFLILLTLWLLLTGFTPVTDPLPVILVASFIILDIGRLSVVLIYAGICGITGAFVAWKISKKTATSVSLRKVFHLVIVIVYLIGIICQCTMLFLASGLLLALFVIFEAARLINFPVIAQHLQAIVGAFVDEKDAGVVALTPIYLLAGCSLPLWLHPAPCDLTDSTAFTLLPLLAGILSVGIGDTMAGVIGSKLGRHRLANSQKTIEGTLANILSQVLTIFILHLAGLISLHLSSVIASLVGVTVSALLEAKTDQVDNLFLPLVTFIIFSVRI
ncbi:dolichol kinase [Phlebotomus argentipes]|uniref:dolichol kinase n=1 Tax=Phlebotomus argentipes TaxID=94469 RepID=UPI00289303F3|nr:dolichol kinase [Phlebotomus argentipes]XP_059607801.1 dolichol kinase [Phlebotomus argentipes]